MELRDWVQERFGTADASTLLDEEVYSTKDLRKDKAKLEQNLRQIEKERDKHKQRYENLLQKGAEADEVKQQQLAQKAKFEKKKYKIKKKKHKAQSVKMGTIISIEGMREVMSMHDEENYVIDDLFDDEMNAQELQSEIMDQMAEFGLEMEDMQQVQDALDIEVLDSELETEASEEMELMQKMQAEEISREEVDIEESVEVEQDEVDVGGVELDESISEI
jgi:hypothetical protein